ncbi:hypothetical protein ABIB34_004449 [Rhodococcus sp. UYP5]
MARTISWPHGLSWPVARWRSAIAAMHRNRLPCHLDGTTSGSQKRVARYKIQGRTPPGASFSIDLGAKLESENYTRRRRQIIWSRATEHCSPKRSSERRGVLSRHRLQVSHICSDASELKSTQIRVPRRLPRERCCVGTVRQREVQQPSCVVADRWRRNRGVFDIECVHCDGDDAELRVNGVGSVKSCCIFRALGRDEAVGRGVTCERPR